MATTTDGDFDGLRGKMLPAGLTEQQARTHDISPAHIRNVRIEEVNESLEVKYPLRAITRKFRTTPNLDLEAFGLEVYTALKDLVAGYLLQIRQDGQVVHLGVWNWAQTPADLGRGWNEDTRMHVASVSKFLTAVGLVKALESTGIHYGNAIIDYLPSYWSTGDGIDEITFRQLLTHRSGFASGVSVSDYTFMKSKVADGVIDVGSYDYENMNFGLCRILIPIINGDISRTTEFFPAFNDQMWDAVTLSYYQTHMQTKVFDPAGVSDASFAPRLIDPNALAYTSAPGNTKGWNSGNLATVAGGAGWRLSPSELLKVLDAVRRRSTIVNPDTAQFMLDNYFGIDQAIDTPAGKIYNKNGSWGHGDGRTEQCVAHFLPNDMELVLFVNSPIGTEGFSLRGIVNDAFVNSLSD